MIWWFEILMLNIKTQNNVFICLQLIFQLQNLWKEIPHRPPVFYFSPLLLWGGILTSKCNTVVPLIFFFLPRLHATSGDTAEDLHYHLHNNASNHKGEQLAFIFEILLKQSSAVPGLIHLYCSNTSTTWHWCHIMKFMMIHHEIYDDMNLIQWKLDPFFPIFCILLSIEANGTWEVLAECVHPKSLLNPCEHSGPCISYQWWLFLSLGVTY